MSPIGKTGETGSASSSAHTSSSTQSTGSGGERITTRNRLVTVLTDDNFVVWKWNLRYTLKALGLYDCVTVRGAGTPAQQDDAMLEIISTLDDKIKIKVAHCLTPYDLFQAIESIYTNKTSFQVTALHMRLSSFKFASSTKISEGVSEIQNIVSKLKNLGENVSDHMIEGIVLAALPSSFRTFITVWKGMSEGERTLSNLFNRIMAEIEDNKLFNVRDDQALYTRGQKFRGNVNSFQKKPQSSKSFRPNNNQPNRNFRNNSSVNQTQNKGVCNYCKKPGHWMKECRKLESRRKFENGQQNSKPAAQKTNEKVGQVAFMASLEDSKDWIADSGASRHMTCNSEWFEVFEEFPEARKIYLADDKVINAIGAGNIQTNMGLLTNVWLVPDISHNLFSIPAAVKNGITARINESEIKFYSGERNVLNGKLVDNVYVLNLEICRPHCALTATIDEWHQRLGHVSTKVIKNMADKGLVTGLVLNKGTEDIVCECCASNKGQSASHPSRTSSRTEIPGQSLHFDTVGPMKDPSLAGSHYYLLCKDEASGFRQVAFVEAKADIMSEVAKIIMDSERATKNSVVRICTDNGSEFVNHKLGGFLKSKAINHIVSAPYTPQQNGFIERDIRTVTSAARTMLNSAALPAMLWAEATATAVFVLNRIPSSRQPDSTPYELWFGEKPSVKNMHIFGQEAIVDRPIYMREGKWDVTGDKMYFVGYTNLSNTFRFYDPRKEKIMITCNVTFLDKLYEPIIEEDQPLESNPIEREVIMRRNNCIELPTIQEESDCETEVYEDPMERSVRDVVIEPEHRVSTQSSPSREMNQEVSETSQTIDIPKKLWIRGRPPQLTQSRLRVTRSSADLVNTEHAKISTIEANDDPGSYQEAISGNNTSEWIEAMKEEIQALKKNQVYELSSLPEGANLVTCRWVFKTKRRPDGEIERYRARLVARGFSQIEGIDYSATFAPVVSTSVVRLLFAQASIEGLVYKQFDIKTAFLYGNLDEEVYMQQPEGFDDSSPKVWRLKRSLYGLKQAPRQWNIEFTSYLKSMGLVQSQYDHCVFFRTNNPKIILVIYVDDGLVFADDEETAKEIINGLKQRFDVHEEDSEVFLGFQVKKNCPTSYSLHQEGYIRKILKKYNMDMAKLVDTPSSTSRKTVAEETAEPLPENVPYREAIGSLLYAANITRIDIAFQVNKVSRKVADPSTYDWQCVKRIFRYLKGTDNACITYSRDLDEGLYAYCDADFAGDEASGRSTTGYVILYGGAPIQWRSQKQPLVTLSSTEAELVSLCSLVKELVWLRDLIFELQLMKKEPTTIYCDNQSAIRLAKDEKSVQRTRHMGVRAAFTREKIEAGEIKVEHVKTDAQVADFLTKPLTTVKHIINRSRLMAFVTLICLLFINLAHGFTFEQISPIVWLPTKNYVDAGVVEYDLTLTFINPCAELLLVPQPMIPVGARHGMHLKRQTHLGNQIPNQAMSQPQVLTQGQVLQAQQQQVPQQQLQQQFQQGAQQQTHIGARPVVQSKLQQMPIELSHEQLEERVNNYILDECNNMWDQLFLHKLNDWTKRLPRYTDNNNRIKRDLGSAIETASEIVFGTCISNMISSVFSRLDPESNRNKIKDIVGRLEEHKEAIAEFRREFNLTRVVHQGMIETMTAFGRVQYEQHHRIEQLIDVLPRTSWTSSYIQSKITTAAADLQVIIDKYSLSGQVATRELARMFGIDSLKVVPDSDTEFTEAKQLSDDTIHLRFLVRQRAEDTAVYRVGAFKYWENLTETPTLKEYRGHNYLVYNKTSNCLKAIDEPLQPAVLEECSTMNFTDSRLQIWETLVETRDISKYPHTCQSMRTLAYNYIYCFPFDIVTQFGKLRNPPYPHRISTSQPYQLPIIKHEYKPIIRKLNLTGPNELPAIDSIHVGHFSSDSNAVDQAAWFDKIQGLQKQIEGYKVYQENIIAVTKHSSAYWLIVFSSILLIITVIAMGIYIWLGGRAVYCSERHIDQIPIHTIGESHGNRGNVLKKSQNDKIKVGNNESLTININSSSKGTAHAGKADL